MILNKNHLEKINSINSFIIENYDYFSNYEHDEEMIFSEGRMEEIIEDEEDIKNIEYHFPGEHDAFFIDTDELLELEMEIRSIEIVNSYKIKTNLRRYYIVAATDSHNDYQLRTYNFIEPIVGNGYGIKLLNESLIVGLAATKLEEYDDDYWGTVTQYLTIEIVYENKDAIIEDDKEQDLVQAYIFEIADTSGIALTLSEIKNPINDNFSLDEEGMDLQIHSLRELEPINEGMRMFISAVQTKDPELKFLNFYKVLEHFSPIAVNIEANELMRKKLDVSKSSFEDGDYIRSLFDLANSMRDRFNDEDLIKAAFTNCFDFVGLSEKLPESIKKKIKKHLNIQELSYSNDKQQITTASNITAKIINKTRNKVVHAKSNFTLTGEEITSTEFQQLNNFMKEASSQAIRWYNRQPNHLKREIIR